MADLGTTLLTLARNAIAAHFGLPGRRHGQTCRNCTKTARPS